MEITRAGGALGIPGLYVTGDPGASDEAAKHGSLSIRLGLGWAKSLAFTTGQCPVMRYHRQLMMAILNDRVQIAKAVNAIPIPLDQAPQGYQEFDQGAASQVRAGPARHARRGQVAGFPDHPGLPPGSLAGVSVSVIGATAWAPLTGHPDPSGCPVVPGARRKRVP